MRAVLRSDTNVINCPFCGEQNKQPSQFDDSPPEPLCCYDFAQCVNAVMLKLETDHALNAAERIAEQADKSVN